MTDDLYERYKEALRTGHVAVLRGRLEEAIESYQTAASIAPARALPHSSLGGVYLRLNRIDDALAEYAAAVARAPQDEGALLGQAEALTAVDRFVDAAIALDRVAQLQETAGRLPEAADTIRRALELDEAPERVRRQRALLRQIRLSAGDQAAEEALARALRLREQPDDAEGVPMTAAPATGSTVPVPAEVAARSGPGSRQPTDEAADMGEPQDAPVMEIAGTQVPEATEEIPVPAEEPTTTVARPEGKAAERESESESAADAVGPATWTWPRAIVWEPEEIGAASGAIPAEARAVPGSAGEPEQVGQGEAERLSELAGSEEPAPAVAPQPGADELVSHAAAAEAAGNDAEARLLLVAAAREYAKEGRYDAGLDTAQQLLRDYPSDVDVHLVLVELYISRNWETLAAEKLLLLGRLADLDDDEETRLRLCAAASQAVPDDGRLASLCS